MRMKTTIARVTSYRMMYMYIIRMTRQSLCRVLHAALCSAYNLRVTSYLPRRSTRPCTPPPYRGRMCIVYSLLQCALRQLLAPRTQHFLQNKADMLNTLRVPTHASTFSNDTISSTNVQEHKYAHANVIVTEMHTHVCTCMSSREYLHVQVVIYLQR